MLKKTNETNPNPWTSTQCYEILKIIENEHMFKIHPTHKTVIEIHQNGNIFLLKSNKMFKIIKIQRNVDKSLKIKQSSNKSLKSLEILQNI